MFVNNTGIRYSFSHHAVPFHPSVMPEQYFERSCCELNKYIRLFLGSFYSWNSSLFGFTAGSPQSCASVIWGLVSRDRRVGMIVGRKVGVPSAGFVTELSVVKLWCQSPALNRYMSSHALSGVPGRSWCPTSLSRW